MEDVSLPHRVKVNGVPTLATCARLSEDSLGRVLERWREDYESHKDSCSEFVREAVYDWEWVLMSKGSLRRTYGLSVEGYESPVGLMSVRLGCKTKSPKRSCVHIQLLAKSPKAFVIPTVSGVGRCLVAEAIWLSLEFQSQGRVRIPEALSFGGAAAPGNPSRLYRDMGFEGAQAIGNGVEYEDLEISAARAENLIEEYRNG